MNINVTKTDPNEWHFDKDEQRRLKLERLLKVAATCFNEKGFSGTSLKDVATRLGITDAALYYYVKNKEELVNLCYVRATDLAEEALDKAINEGTTPAEKLDLFIRYQIDRLTGSEGPIATMSELPALSQKHRDPLLVRATRHQKRVAQLILGGVADGSLEVCDPIATCNVILGALNWIPKWYKPTSSLDANDVAESFARTLLSGIKKAR
jgi:AcrR family transcriptional regulator